MVEQNKSNVAITMSDGSIEWWELTDEWAKVRTDPPLETLVTEEELAIALSAKSDTSHSHPTHGDINFTGTVSADGLPGITGEFEGTFKKIKIQDGLIVEFELE